MGKSSRITVEVEPEAQFSVPDKKTFERIIPWLLEKGAKPDKKQHDDCTYFDTKHFRLAREGWECRVKEKGGIWRTDIKTPIDTRDRVALPNKFGVVDRREIKAEQTKDMPSLKDFADVAALAPVAKRVKDFFDKNLEPKFRAPFTKDKYDRVFEWEGKKATIQYSLQDGHIESLDGKVRTKEMYIAEIEFRGGSRKAYLKAVKEFKDAFGESGVAIMKERKWHIGLRLIAADLSEKSQDNLGGAFKRMGRADPSIRPLELAA